MTAKGYALTFGIMALAIFAFILFAQSLVTR